MFSSQTSSIFVSNWMRNPGETWQQSRLQMEICKTHEKNQPDFGGLYLFEVIYSMVVSAHCTAVYKRILYSTMCTLLGLRIFPENGDFPKCSLSLCSVKSAKTHNIANCFVMAIFHMLRTVA